MGEKLLGAVLDKNMLRVALDKKLCLERRHKKKLLGDALDKNMQRAAFDIRYARRGAS